MASSRQHTFDFLRGDSHDDRPGRRFPFYAYYSPLDLVVEYRERQHAESVPFFDKAERLTVSGVHRGLQRTLYDQRRREVLPRHGITLVEVAFSDFAHGSQLRLLRHRWKDMAVLRRILAPRVRGAVIRTELQPESLRSQVERITFGRSTGGRGS